MPDAGTESAAVGFVLRARESRYRIAALALLTMLFALSLYRAATQSIVHDEALTWQFYLTGPASQIFEFYDANNHVLNTILCRVSVSLFGLSEFALRLPSLLGGLLYLVMVFRLARFLFGETVYFLLCIALLGLNPLVLDFLSAARGYGLALAFFMYALYHLLCYLGKGARTVLLYRAGFALAASVASNLTLLFPAVSLVGMFLSAATSAPPPVAKKAGKRKRRHRKPAQPSLGGTASHLLLPFVVTAWLVVSGPISRAEKGDFYAGAGSLWKSVMSLVATSVLHETSFLSGWLPQLTFVACVLVVLIIVSAAVIARKTRDSALSLVAGVMLATLLLLVIVHYAFKLPYPEDRTGLYWIPLLGLAAVMVARSLQPALLRTAGAFVLGAIALQFALQLKTRHYAVWPYDAHTREVMELIRATHTTGRARVGVTWHLEPAVNFYRERFRLDWMDPVTRRSPNGDFDYYLLLPPDTELVDKLHLKPIYRNSFTNVVLAVKTG